MKTTIKNIGVLDLRSASEQAVAAIEKIDNVGVIMCSPETSHLVSKLSIGNIGSTVIVSNEYEIHTGKLELNGESLKKISSPLYLYVSGLIIIKEDTLPEDIEKNIGGLIVTGKIICPGNLASAVQSKIVSLTGKLLSYPQNAQFIKGPCNFNDSFLNSLKQSSILFIDGNLKVIEPLNKKLMEEKIESIEVSGKVLMAEENAEILNRKLKNSSKQEVIPANYIYIENDITFDSISIKKFNAAKIYAAGIISFKEDIDEQMLKNHITAIKTGEAIICRQNLREYVADICECYSPDIIYYSAKHIIVDHEYELDSSELEFSEEKISILVKGMMSVAKDVTAEMILEKIEFIDNFGMISAGRRQLGAIKNRMRINKGALSGNENGSNNGDNAVISNVGSLKL